MVGSAVYPAAKYSASRPRLSATPASTAWPEAGQRVEVGEDQRAQPGHLAREQVAAVQREAGQHPRVVGGQLGAEVEAFLQVGLAGGELGADREETPPGPAAAGHGDLQLVGRRQREELGAGLGQPGEQLGGHAVPGHVEEAVLAAGRLDLPRHRPAAAVPHQ